MKNYLDNILTRDEQKVFGFLAAFLIIGMLLYHAGITKAYAEKTDAEQEKVQAVVRRDSLFLVDIRTADKEELLLLPGIGEKRAEDILAYRRQKQFESTQEILNISGIGAKTYLNMLPMLVQFGEFGKGVTNRAKLTAVQQSQKACGNVVQNKRDSSSIGNSETRKEKSTGQTGGKILLNSATKEELMLLDGIGEKKAQAILDYRKQIGRFNSVEQLLEVKGIGPKTLEKNRHRLGL